MNQSSDASVTEPPADLVSGNELFAQALRQQGVDVFFFIMGGPMRGAQIACVAEGLRGIDVRHEQAAAMMAHAYSRVSGKCGVCMAAKGPGALNLHAGLANALVDCIPVVAFGGASKVSEFGIDSFQEIDQVAAMRPVTKWAERIYDARRVPELVDRAFREAMSGRPGPVYIDLPSDILYQKVPRNEVLWPATMTKRLANRPAGDPGLISAAVQLLQEAKRPVIIVGSGVLWSEAWDALRTFVEQSGIPVYMTPQSRGAVPEDHRLSFPAARSTAFREADVVLVVGTRMNFALNYGLPPRFSADAKIVLVDIDNRKIDGNQRADIGIVGDARTVLEQLAEGARDCVLPAQFAQWQARLAADHKRRLEKQDATLNSDQIPIHPMRLCREVRDFIDRDAILVVDGQDILNFGRQSIPTFMPRHRLNSGPFGMMGVGMPFGVGAKVAKPDTQVVILHGDGSFGMNGMELDTAVRHKLPVLVVISLNGGWTADPKKIKPGRDLGYTRFDEIAKVLGCHGEYVERPEDIKGALQRAGQAVAAGKCALVNVVTDRIAATTAKFTDYST